MASSSRRPPRGAQSAPWIPWWMPGPRAAGVDRRGDGWEPHVTVEECVFFNIFGLFFSVKLKIIHSVVLTCSQGALVFRYIFLIIFLPRR